MDEVKTTNEEVVLNEHVEAPASQGNDLGVGAQPVVVQIGLVESVIGIVVVVVTAAVSYGKLKGQVAGIDKTIDKEIKPKIDDLVKKVYSMWADKLSTTNSPRVLNERGEKVLEKSGIKEIIDNKKDILLEKVKERNPTNAYDAEVVILRVVNDLPKNCPDIDMDKLKNGAFNVGADINAVLFVGGIYLRDSIFSDLGFKIDELDEPKTHNSRQVNKFTP